MTKKVKISFLILVWSIVAVQMFVNDKDQEKSEEVVTAFSVMDEVVTGETIKGYGYFGTMDISDDMKKNMLENMALKLGIQEGYTFSKGTGVDFEKMILTKEGKYATTTCQVISLLGGEQPEQYLLVQVQTKAKIDEAYQLYEKVKKLFREIEVSSQVSMEVEMEQQGNLKENGGDRYVKQVFALIDAKEVDRIEENDIYTVYGYSKEENNYLMLQGEKVNVQLVMTYDEKVDKTYVKVGVPMVNSSY